VSTSTCTVSRAAFSFSSTPFRSAKALVAEYGSPGTMPRAMSYSMNAVKGRDDQFRTLFKHGLIPEKEIR
jgi:hypothetical protein